MTPFVFRFPALLAAALAVMTWAAPVAAQSLFDPVVRVNDRVITKFELDQRVAFYKLLNAPGDLEEFAMQTLIDERLQLEAAARLGVTLTPEQLEAGLTEFASRADMTSEAFVEAIGTEGVSPETFRDFVRAGLVWREVVGSRFAPRSQVTEAEIDRAIASASSPTGGVRVLLSEIILPAADPQQEQAARRLAAELSQIASIDRFAAAARNYSAASTRNAGGRLDWLALANVPPAVAGQVLTLKPGEVTQPIPIPNGIALFQLRALEETGSANPATVAVEFARYFIPGGRSGDALAQADRIAARVDTCDDLYGVAQGQPRDRLQRDTVAMSELSGEIAQEIDRLDPGEISTNLVSADGQTLIFLMLCARTQVQEDEVDRAQIRDNLFNQRLASYATGFLAELRADAVIEYP